MPTRTGLTSNAYGAVRTPGRESSPGKPISAAGSFHESERFAVDFDVWLRLARRYSFVASREVTANWRWHDSQLSGSLTRHLEATYRSRSTMFREVENAGEQALASELAAIFRTRWTRDAQEAWDTDQIVWLLRLVELAQLVPGLPPSLRRKLALRSRIPRTVVDAIRAYRAPHKPALGVNAGQ